MMSCTRASGGAWMAGSASDLRLPASLPGLESDIRWRNTTPCHSPNANENSILKNDLPPSSSFSKGMLDDEWYIEPENTLMDEMKELSCASSLASLPDSVSAAHFNLDAPHLQGFLPRNLSRPFSSMDNRSPLSTFLDGSLSYDGTSTGTGTTLMNNFRQSGAGLGPDSSSGILMPMLGQNRGGLLSNLSPRSGLEQGFNQSLGSSLSSFLNNGMNNSFTSAGGGTTLGSSFNHGSSLGTGPGGFCDSFNNSLSRNFLSMENSLLLNVERPPFRSKHPLNSQAVVSNLDSHQTLFQKRAALRHAVSGGVNSPTIQSHPRVITSASNDSSVNMPDEESPNVKPADKPDGCPTHKEEKKLTRSTVSDEGCEFGLDRDECKDEDDMDESGDGSGLYEVEDTLGMEGGCQGMSHGLPVEKGKGKKGLPAKNLMAERRRRKKLNDRLYMLRSVVPKITKMDRASILGDAIEYLKELLERIHDLHNELESTTPPPVDRPSSGIPPLPSTTKSLACRVKEESPSSTPSPDSEPPRVEVRTREGRALNIHMFCSRKPGLLLSTMRALDGLGLEVQQAVVSCFNGFALDVFRAEQVKDAEVGAEEIRAVLLHAAGRSLGSNE